LDTKTNKGCIKTNHPCLSSLQIKLFLPKAGCCHALIHHAGFICPD